ncbi:MAG: nicotinate (nicotinamide) nucleotide adenylyltransferase [Candidatus Dormibacteria bacterium]
MPEAASAVITFGGTFDPPHLGHLAVIKELRRLLDLPLVVVPTGIPGHRAAPGASPIQRAEMIEAAVQALNDRLVAVCRREVELPQPTFTVDTVTAWRRERPARSLVLAMGSDVAAGLPHWKEVGRLLGQVKLLIFERPSVGEPGSVVLEELRRRQLPLVGAEVIALDVPQVEATGIRERIAAGIDARDLIPGPVADYIQAHGLYRAQPELPLPAGAG